MPCQRCSVTVRKVQGRTHVIDRRQRRSGDALAGVRIHHVEAAVARHLAAAEAQRFGAERDTVSIGCAVHGFTGGYVGDAIPGGNRRYRSFALERAR